MTTPPKSWVSLGVIAACGAILVLAIMVPASRRQAAILRADPERILSDPALRDSAVAAGAPVYRRHCASCHGIAGKGDAGLGVPDLTDDDHLYGSGLVAEIEEIARHGIRSGDRRGWRLASMPAYASARPYKDEPLPALTPSQIEDITQFMLGFQGRATDPAARARGGTLYQDFAGCWDCHGHNAAGDAGIGAPSLTDDIWLYGHGGHDDIHRSIAGGRAGVSPAFQKHLSAADLRDVAVYVAALQPARPQ